MLRVLPSRSMRPPVRSHRLQLRPSFPRRHVRLLASKTVLEPPFLDSEVEEKEEVGYDYDPLTPQQVKELISTVCSDTQIAHLELQFGDYRLKLRRSLGGHQAPVTSVAPIEKGAASMESTIEDSFIEEDGTGSIEETTMMIDSPKVGYFRFGVYNKNGKKVGKSPIAGDQVRAGQPLCAIEQLGTFTPILAPQKGEVLSFPCQDGEPVAYKDTVVEFTPYFGGYIIGDKKYA